MCNTAYSDYFQYIHNTRNITVTSCPRGVSRCCFWGAHTQSRGPIIIVIRTFESKYYAHDSRTDRRATGGRGRRGKASEILPLGPRESRARAAVSPTAFRGDYNVNGNPSGPVILLPYGAVACTRESREPRKKRQRREGNAKILIDGFHPHDPQKLRAGENACGRRRKNSRRGDEDQVPPLTGFFRARRSARAYERLLLLLLLSETGTENASLIEYYGDHVVIYTFTRKSYV